MNTSALKRFAQQARNILKTGIEKQLIYWGYNPKTKQFTTEAHEVFGGAEFGGKLIDDPDFYKKWIALKSAVLIKGVDQVAEQAAYTWFNRLMAIHILAKNNYIIPQLEYTSAETRTPLIVQAAKRGISPRMSTNQAAMMNSLIEDDRLETELFTLLITAYCHGNELLQRVFGRMDDFTELLLPADILATKGFIDLLNTTDAITDEDYRQVELIGWLYQFYISEKKAEVDKKPKVLLEDIPAATQIFTPNWIVKYMVQNTVGRIWLDLNPESRIREQMKYLVENPDVKVQPIVNEVAQIKLLDPACGSGHILVEGFDILYSMYREEGYSAVEAVKSIFTDNLWGLDIDARATQLSTFALLLKAAAKDRTVLDRNILPHVYPMPETQAFSKQEVMDFLGEANAAHSAKLYDALILMQQSQNLGSIMKFSFNDKAQEAINQQISAWESKPNLDLLHQDLWKRLSPYLQVLQLLMQHYEAVVANPPYMGDGKMNGELKKYIQTKYPLSKADLFSVFMEVCLNFCQIRGRMGMINMHSWMFLSSFEALRKMIIDTYYIENMLHLGPHTFDELGGEVVQNTAFVFRKSKSFETGVYYRLVNEPNCSAKENAFFKIDNLFTNINQFNFVKIKGSPVAYWASKNVVSIFNKADLLDDSTTIRQGLATGNNLQFLRLWFEINNLKFFRKCKSIEEAKSINIKWMPFNKGGENRKWSGNYDFVIAFDKENIELLSKSGNQLPSKDLYFKKGITWTAISTSKFSVREHLSGSIFSNAGMVCILDNKIFEYVMALLNSKVLSAILSVLSPTLNFNAGDIKRIPLIISSNLKINDFCLLNIVISKSDWDSHETSWDFEKQPLINLNKTSLESAYQSWEEKVTQDFYQLHANETELNRIFIEIYGLQEELTAEVKLKDITILQEEIDSTALSDATKPIGKLPIKKDVVIRQMVSYMIGCLLGRYRLDKPGLYIAHPNPSAEETAAYEYNGCRVNIDEDAIVPLMDNSCSFGDNALIQLKNLLEIQWGADEKLIETINYLEAALGKELENYLVKDFWKDHCQRYQKRPIYWLFASPKGAFQVITYMHRMNKYTVEKIRKYLLRHISNLENREAVLSGTSDSLDRIQIRELEKLQRDLQECRDYDLVLKDVADHQIEFDLDDGVTVNYQKFGSVVATIK
ncbi:MAG: BREX-1 system adenine-specific DNA-methyltransferase PglX [Bacteroidetes bacterium]|nr:BREX-1 system adenine-specific DNA-methyltransferase PglX [Bacteroidota bacterium]